MTRTKQTARQRTGPKYAVNSNSDDQTSATRPVQTEYDASIGMKDPSLLSDHFAQRIKHYYSDSTAIELEGKYIPSRAFRDTTGFPEPRVATHATTFLNQHTKGGQKHLSTCDEPASPHTMVICSSGIRTADLVREFRAYESTDCKVAKLFAKHMKLQENIDYVQNSKIGVAVGTPSRLKDLVQAGALKVDDLKRIVIDGSYTDEKMRTIFDMGEIFQPMVELLNEEQIKSSYGDKIEILVF